MEFQVYDVPANSLSNYFNNNTKSICPSTFYNNSQYSMALDIMENDEYFNWNPSEAKHIEPTILQHPQNNQQLNLSGNRKRKLDNSDQLNVQDDNDSVIVDDSSDSSADSSLASSHDSVIKGPPAKAIMLKTNVAVAQQHLILGHPKMISHNGQHKKDHSGNGGNRMPQWQVEDIAELNADIEGSLNDHANQPTFNINDTILSISGMTVFKQEAPSPTSTSGHISSATGRQLVQLVQCGGNQYGRSGNGDTNNNNGGMYNSIGDQGQQHMNNGYGGQQQQQRETHSPIDIDGSPTTHSPTTAINHIQLQADSYPSISSTNTAVDETGSNSSTSGALATTTTTTSGRDRQFQYVLGAATSIATKMNEDTLTYLNQGQSYEIKLKPVLVGGGSGDVMGQCRGKRLQSVIRVCFHERRLQYMEREQMLSWQRARPGDRILDMDVPLSYGVSDVIQSSNQLNSIQFNWDPTKDTGAYIKVNCISTEFTPKKHGGEKGVPFRIQVATYDNSGAQRLLLHAAACQVKVFKLKGADRKHKQDRDKVLKRPVIEQDKYQPSYDYTVLNEISSDAVVSCLSSDTIDPLSCESYSRNGGQSVVNTPIVPKVNISIPEAKPQLALTAHVNSNEINGAEKLNHEQQSLPSSITTHCDGNSLAVQTHYPRHHNPHQQLNTSADPSQASRWLVGNRFERYLSSFANFSGADLLRMSRDDLMQVCGQADGIRLYNALHSKTIAPALTLYISRNRSSPYHAIYLRNFSTVELQTKLIAVLSLTSDCISAIYVQGPQGIHVHLEDAVLHHIKDETMFNVAILHNNNSENSGTNGGTSFAILLQPESVANGNVKGSSFDDRNYVK